MFRKILFGTLAVGLLIGGFPFGSAKAWDLNSDERDYNRTNREYNRDYNNNYNNDYYNRYYRRGDRNRCPCSCVRNTRDFRNMFHRYRNRNCVRNDRDFNVWWTTNYHRNFNWWSQGDWNRVEVYCGMYR